MFLAENYTVESCILAVLEFVLFEKIIEKTSSAIIPETFDKTLKVSEQHSFL